MGEAEDVDEGYKLIEALKPQIVFLDIQMPRTSGFTLLKKYQTIPFEVIFVTSYDQFAINAIKFNALDYLVKPVEVKDLRDSINRARKAIDLKTQSNEQIINLLHNLESEEKEKKIAVHVGENVKLISTINIRYIEADGRYCNIFTCDNGKYTTAKYIKEFEDYFGPSSNFIRINKALIINVMEVDGYSKGEPFIITMNGGKTFEVSRRKKPEVLDKLK